MRRAWLLAIACVLPVLMASAGSDDLAGSGSGSGSAGSDTIGSAGSAGSDAVGSAGSDPAAGSSGSGSGSGSGAGSWLMNGSGSGSGSAAKKKHVLITIPPDVVAPKASASASPSQMRLGQQFTVFVDATFQPGVEVNIEEPVDLGGAFEVRKKVTNPDRTNPDGTRTREWQLAVYAWELGDLEIPEIAVTFTAMGKAGQVATNAVPVKVIGVLGEVVDDPKLVRASSPPIKLISRDWFWAIVIAVAGGLLVALAIYALARKLIKRKNVVLSSGAISVSRRIDMTSERALQRLLHIERSGALADTAKRKLAYDDMVEIIREYLGNRYRVATLDLTALELVRALAQVAPSDEREDITRFLARCELVKYGGLQASEEQARRTLEDARALVVASSTLRSSGAAASQKMARVA